MAVTLGVHNVTVHDASGGAPSGAITNAALTTTAGSTLIVIFGSNLNAALPNISGTDSLGNTWTEVGTGITYAGGGYRIRVYKQVGGTRGAGHTVTVSKYLASEATLFFAEVPGGGDVTGFQTGTIGSTNSGATGTGVSITAAAGDMLLAANFGEASGSNHTFTPVAPWARVDNEITPAGITIQAELSYLIVSTPGTYTPSWVYTVPVAETSATFTLSIAASGPAITAQPTDQTVNNGATATFSVTATGTAPITYQWQDNSSGSFANIGGATSSSYAPTASYAIQGRQYRCVVTDGSSASVTSDAATLRVAFNLSGTGPRAYPTLGAPFGAGSFESWLRGATAGGATTVAPGTGHLALNGKQPTISQTITTTVAPGAGHLALTGRQPTIAQTITTTVAPGKGALTLTGYAPAITRTTAIAPGTGHLLLGGYAPSVSQRTNVSPSTGHLVLTAYAPSIVRITALTPGTGRLTLTGYAPTVSQSSAAAVSPGTGHLITAGYAPTVTRTANQVVNPGVGHLLLAGYAPSLTRTTVLVPGVGHLVMAGYVPTISQSANLSLTPGTGHALLTGYAPTVTRTANQAVAPGTGHLTLSGHAPSVSNGGAVWPAPADVRSGVQYGPTGVEYTGTQAGGGSYLRRR